jgi:hypothetical protein
MVQMLQSRLQAEEAAHTQALSRNTQLQRQLHEELAEAEDKCLEYCKRIDQLNVHLEQASSMEAEQSHAHQAAVARAQQAEERVGALEKNSDTLRRLMMDYLSQPAQNSAARRTLTEKSFWDKLATPELLQKSEPPKSFPMRENLHPAQLVEFQQMKSQLHQTRSQVKKLLYELEQTSAKCRKLESERIKERKEVKSSITRQQQQLVGAVRRIAYLVDERGKDRLELEKKELYVQRLEARLLQQAEEIRHGHASAAHAAHMSGVASSGGGGHRGSRGSSERGGAPSNHFHEEALAQSRGGEGGMIEGLFAAKLDAARGGRRSRGGRIGHACTHGHSAPRPAQPEVAAAMAAATALSAADSNRRLQDRQLQDQQEQVERQRFGGGAAGVALGAGPRATEASAVTVAIDQRQDQRFVQGAPAAGFGAGQAGFGAGQADVSSAVDERTVLDALIHDEFSVEEIEGFTAKLAQNFTDFYK